MCQAAQKRIAEEQLEGKVTIFEGDVRYVFYQWNHYLIHLIYRLIILIVLIVLIVLIIIIIMMNATILGTWLLLFLIV